MSKKLETIGRDMIWMLPMLGAIFIIIALFTPFALSIGAEGISMSSQSDVWYWGFYREQGQTEFLQTPVMLNVILSIIMLLFAILILVFSMKCGLNKLNRKTYGEAIAIFVAFIYFSMTLSITFIEYAFSLLPDLEPAYAGLSTPFWSYRIGSFGISGINYAIFLIVLGSLLSLRESKKSFFYIEITGLILWMFTTSTQFLFL